MSADPTCECLHPPEPDPDCELHRTPAQAAAKQHWLTWNTIARTITGCHCGFRADESSDCGFGDSVVEHLLAVGGEFARPAHLREAAGSLRSVADGMTYAWQASHAKGVRRAAHLLDSTAADYQNEPEGAPTNVE